MAAQPDTVIELADREIVISRVLDAPPESHDHLEELLDAMV